MSGLLNTEQCQAFDEQGYLLVRGVLDEGDFAPLGRVISSAIDHRAKALYDKGKISNLYEEQSFYHRLTRILRESQKGPLLGWNWNKEVFSREVYELTTHPKILDIVTSLIGPEIIGQWRLLDPLQDADRRRFRLPVAPRQYLLQR